MTLLDIVRSLPLRRDELMSAAGYRTHHRALYGAASSIGLFGLGLAVGAGVALLYAPEPGQKLRRRLAERFDGVVHPAARVDGAAPRESAH